MRDVRRARQLDRSIARVGLRHPQPSEKLPASPIRVKFAINQDGRLNVSAIDLTAGSQVDVEFRPNGARPREVEERSTALR